MTVSILVLCIIIIVLVFVIAYLDISYNKQLMAYRHEMTRLNSIIEFIKEK